jgi:ABC-2 type transport system permease protein
MWRSLTTATWLGWQIESNWASPALFALYAVVKPLTSAAILVVMFGMITQGAFGSPAFAYMFVGNAFYMYVAAVMAGMAQAVIDDRERFRTLKAMYVAPVSFPSCLMGRTAARFLTTTLSVIITLVCGIVFLKLDLDVSTIRWPLLVVSVAVGVVMLSMMGLALAGVVLTITHGSWLVGEAVAAALYLFCGAVFPISALPPPLRAIGHALPVTYWLELVRRALIGPAADRVEAMPGISDAGLVALSASMTLALAGIAVVLFRRCDHVARERGLIDRTTNY